jgi:hypothetical protein
VSGDPRNEYDAAVDITADGGLNEAAFRVTVDGAVGKAVTVPERGGYAVPNTGLTLQFTPGDSGFKAASETVDQWVGAPAGSEEGSGYSLVERRRVMGKACRQIRAARLFCLNGVVTAGADGLPLWNGRGARRDGMGEGRRG